jgi:hypothetical protein
MMNPYEAPTTTTPTTDPSPDAQPSLGNPRAVSAWAWGVVFVTLIVNAFLLFVARADHGWGALYILIFVAPVANVTIMVVSLLWYFVVRIQAQGASMYYYGQACLGAPILAMIVDVAAILSMDIHG